MKIFPKARRRQPGLYAYRTRKHLRPGTEWGYGGYSTSLPDRYRCHAGTCGKHKLCKEKPWYDLKVAYFELRLPWWLGWKWLLLSLETIMIALLRPRYNDQKNPRHNKVRLYGQRVQRASRDALRAAERDVWTGRAPGALWLPYVVIAGVPALYLTGYFITR